MFFIINSYIFIMDSLFVLLFSEEFILCKWLYNSKNEVSGVNLFLFLSEFSGDSSGDSMVFPGFIKESNKLLTNLDKNSI